MGRKCIRSPSLIITEQPAWCAAARPMIFSPSPVNRTSRSWKPRHSLATSSQDVFRMDQDSPSFSTNIRSKLGQSLCIQKNRWSLQPQVAAVMRQKEKNEHEFPQSALTAHKIMIGEGIKSANQRRHNYVQENVEVGFFTDPTVCIGCKACEVACKEWNEVPDDGFSWSGNSYDNTGHLGASTWRHVMFLEQDRQKGNQIVGHHSLEQNGEDPFRWVFLSDVCKHCEEAGCLEACPTGSIVRTEVGSVFVQNDVCNGCG